VGVSVERLAVAVPGGRLALVLHVPDSSSPVPFVIACHGTQSSKESEKLVMLGDALPAAGIALARFDFRGCGESTGREDETTVATRIADAEAVLGHVTRDPRLSGVFGLLGSSMGGFVVLHVAARPQTAGAAAAVVTWNAPSDLKGVKSPAGIARHLTVQGESDDVVPMAHGTALHARAAPPCDIVVVPGGDHRLTEPAHRRQAIDVSVRWFRRFLISEGDRDG
jgi:fermentation-respiration switch protein FrsA (DUF1100 family)